MTQQSFWISTQKNFKTFIHKDICSIIHSGQDMETTKVFFDRGLEKEDVVCIYNGTLLSHKKRWNTAICDNMDRP